jgi:hypothetical protein
MMNYIVTSIAIAGLFINTKKPWLSFFVWTGTSLYWTVWNYRCHDFSQAIMFATFCVSSAIQFWRTA